MTNQKCVGCGANTYTEGVLCCGDGNCTVLWMGYLREQREIAGKDEWHDEREDILIRFLDELTKVTGDGSKKRQAGAKPPWFVDHSHEGAIFSHLTKWKRGEMVDPDSGAHPLVHAAWRCLAIACQESGNVPV